ncbi:MAG TPA: class I SAM-dependent methyltransferase [Candidatus Obscuribacterales bacterium]
MDRGSEATSTRDRKPKANLRKVAASCNLCGSIERAVVTTGREHEYENTTDDLFTVVRCTDCGLVYLDPRPDLSELPTIYPPNYYSYNQDTLRKNANPNSILLKVRYAGFRAKIQKSLSLLQPSTEDKVAILDIGCGDGHLLNLYREAIGDKADTHGVDFNLQAVAMASSQGHKTYSGRFEDVELPDNYFDLVIASHVIEHVPDPKGFTEKVRRVLKAGGIFWFETPNIGSLDAKWFEKEHWGAYHFPRHWYFFSTQTIRQLGERTAFKIELIDYVPNAIFWFWTFHSMIVKAKPEWRKLADALFPPVDFQKDTFANFVRICFFCTVDLAIKMVSGETSNMIVVFRKGEE